MVHTHRRGDDSGQYPRQGNCDGATGPRPRCDQSRKGDPQSAGNRDARSTSARALGEMRPSVEQVLGPQHRRSFSPTPPETRPLSPLRTDSLPLVSKMYWPENVDDAIMDAP